MTQQTEVTSLTQNHPRAPYSLCVATRLYVSAWVSAWMSVQVWEHMLINVYLVVTQISIYTNTSGKISWEKQDITL